MKLASLSSVFSIASLALTLPLVSQAQVNTDAENEDYTIIVQRVERNQAQEFEEIAGPQEDVVEAATVIEEMQQDADLRQLLDEARGVFIIPDYALAALVVGASGGEGVLLAKVDGAWSNPAFYDIGGISAGFQAGVSAGDIAMILMSEDAVTSFLGDNQFALNADAGFSIVDWAARARGQIGRGEDIVLWSDTEGLLAEISIGVNDINFDEEETAEYYGEEASATAVLAGEVTNPHPELLQQALQEQ
ncbi:lipid-binding SYLF domain-containing protein [Proteobacteria bacterium 005FR1]|nr:lipid-binding SYLF domain-containing protein [Proteobacteria bacterium 005FR1]